MDGFTGTMEFLRIGHNGKPTGYIETLRFKKGYVDLDASNLSIETYNVKTGYFPLPKEILEDLKRGGRDRIFFISP